MARKKTLAAALVSLGCLQASSAFALGLGDLSLDSFLNEPLKARVSLLDVGNLDEDQIRVRLATSEDFDRLGVDRAYFLTSIQFSVEIDESGRGVIVLTSEDPVLEPYLDFIIETRWPTGRLLRNYTVLVDPPVFDTRSPVISASERVAAIEEGAGASAADTGTRTAVEDSGTRVRMRESTLEPGAMPQRNFGADTAPEPAPGARYMIRRDETLWSIAKQARVNGVSVQQTMLEVQRLNPDAFIDGNINQIKAGYIIYLPASGDISQADIDATLAAVRQQNEDWRTGRASAPEAQGPALRISSGEEVQTGTEAEAVAAAPSEPAGVSAATLDELERSERERDDLGQRLAALAERMETLERIVELKDAEIASLQQTLAAAQRGAPAQPVAAMPQLSAPAVDLTGEAASAKLPAPSAPAPAATGSLWTWLYVGAGVLLAALLVLLLWRRRQSAADYEHEDEDEDEGFIPRPSARKSAEPDAFADVKLRHFELDLHEEDQGFEADTGSASPVAQATTTADSVRPVSVSESAGQRGYGERWHDQYASDVEAGDALAEADIYIAYGRFTQAIELLRKALRSDPDNVAYRLKLVDLAAEMGDRAEAEAQLAELKRIGGDDAIAQAETALDSILTSVDDDLAASMNEVVLGDVEPVSTQTWSDDLRGLEAEEIALTLPVNVPEPTAEVEDLSSELEHLEFLSEPDSPAEPPPPLDAEPEFLGLEIEDSPVEELDLATEFDRHRERALSDSSEDDFVFADDGDPLATKLDLARAYIDMGDDDGARHILEEVLNEGNAEQQQDARELLDRLG